MAHRLTRIGALAARHWKRTLALALVLIAAVGALSSTLGAGFVDDFRTPGVDSTRAQDLLKERFPQASGDDAQVVFAVDRGTLRRAALQPTLAAVARQPHVSSVSKLQLSPDRRIGYVTVQYDQTADELGKAPRERLEAAAERAESAGVEVSMRGMVVDRGDDELAPVGELIGVLAAVLLLTLLFRSVVAMTLTLVAAFAGLAAGMVLLSLTTAFTDMPTVAPTIATMLGLGAGIDYALFLVARHRERLAAGEDPVQAASHANGTAGAAVLTAGAIVVVAIGGLLAVGIPFVGRMGLAAGLVVATVAVSAVTVMPALLGAAKRRVLPRRERAALSAAGASPDAAPRAGGRATRAAAGAGASSEAARLAERWAGAIARRPVAALLAGAAILLTLAAPVLGLRLGQPDDSNRQADVTQRIAYDRLAEGFGPGFNGPLVLAVALPADRAAADHALEQLRTRALATPDVASVAAPTLNGARDAATLAIIPKSAPQDDATSTLVDRLRDDVVPAALHGSGARAYVGGGTATFDDMAGRISDRLPLFVAAVIGLSLLLLAAAFRSVIVPLVSALFNLLSIGAAYGVVTLLFQTATGASLLGVSEQPVVSFIPMFMFAISFGLSMDYNVFLLSRVREHWLRTGDARGAVVSGLARTSQVIGAAGAIMTLVFLGFVSEPDSTVKMFGIGLATAIAVDVTVVRMLLAPAAFTLLGRHAWWLPRWLDRVLPNVELEGRRPEPQPA